MKKEFMNEFDTVISIAEKYNISVVDAKSAKEELPNFKVTVPLVGGFSTGKSSLINAAMGEKLLPMDITPETAVPTEIYYGFNTVTVIDKDGSERHVPLSDFDFDSVSCEENKIVRIETTNPLFSNIYSVKVVDMPGFDSGYEMHNRAIDDYLPQSLAYIITVSANEGTLRESVVSFLNELKIYNVPVYVVITQSGDKTQRQILDLKNHISDIISRFLKIDDVVIAVTESKGDNADTSQFKDILIDIDNKSDSIYNKHFGDILAYSCSDVEKYLVDRLNQSDLSLEDIKYKKEQLINKMEELENSFNVEKEAFARQIQTSIEQIKSRIASDLNAAQQSIETKILQGVSIEEQINSIVRSSVAAGIQSEVEPKIRRYINKASEAIQMSVNSVSVENSIDTGNVEKVGDAVGNLAITVTSVAMSALATTAAATTMATTLGIAGSALGPIGTAIGVLVGTLISSSVKNNIRKKQEAERKELARQKAAEVITSVIADAGGKVEAYVSELIADVNEKLIEEIDDKHSLLEKSLMDTEEKLRIGTTERENMLAELRNDLDTIRGIVNGI